MSLSNKINMIELYNIYIYEKYKELKNSGKVINNYDLSKIFEWFSCVKLTEKYKKTFMNIATLIQHLKKTIK